LKAFVQLARSQAAGETLLKKQEVANLLHKETEIKTLREKNLMQRKTRHVDGAGLGTAVLEQRDGRWQIVHWHSSAPRRAPAPSATPKSDG
jgi:hypothetical protein